LTLFLDLAGAGGRYSAWRSLSLPLVHRASYIPKFSATTAAADLHPTCIFALPSSLPSARVRATSVALTFSRVPVALANWHVAPRTGTNPSYETLSGRPSHSPAAEPVSTPIGCTAHSRRGAPVAASYWRPRVTAYFGFISTASHSSLFSHKTASKFFFRRVGSLTLTSRFPSERLFFERVLAIPFWKPRSVVLLKPTPSSFP